MYDFKYIFMNLRHILRDYTALTYDFVIFYKIYELVFHLVVTTDI